MRLLNSTTPPQLKLILPRMDVWEVNSRQLSEGRNYYSGYVDFFSHPYFICLHFPCILYLPKCLLFSPKDLYCTNEAVGKIRVGGLNSKWIRKKWCSAEHPREGGWVLTPYWNKEEKKPHYRGGGVSWLVFFADKIQNVSVNFVNYTLCK